MKMEMLHQIKKKSQAVQENWFLHLFYYFFSFFVMDNGKTVENGQLYCLLSQIIWNDVWTLYHVNTFFVEHWST